MANRFPLIVDSSNQNIKELPDGDSLLLGDSEKLLLGDGTDLSLYHDGSNSYLTNATGALKLATESSGIAITIGHTTSETTIGDNLVITGDLSVGGVTLPETIADTVGAMVTSNTESGITVAYDDADNTLDFTVGTLNQSTTGSAATLTTARAIAVAGDVTGTANFDGSAAISITTTLATDAIVTANITNANVTVAKMAANSVDSDQYVDGSIDLVHMSVNSIDSDQYVDGSIDTAHIADDAVTADKLANAINDSIASKATTGKAIAMALVFG